MGDHQARPGRVPGMISNRTSREDAIRERSGAYAAAHARHEAAQAAEIRRWVAEIDEITGAYAARVAPGGSKGTVQPDPDNLDPIATPAPVL